MWHTATFQRRFKNSIAPNPCRACSRAQLKRAFSIRELPNVSGLLYSLRSTHTGTGPQEALYWSKTSTQKATIESGQEGYYMDIGLDASRSSTIYGNGSKVQPRSIYALMIIKA